MEERGISGGKGTRLKREGRACKEERGGMQGAQERGRAHRHRDKKKRIKSGGTL